MDEQERATLVREWMQELMSDVPPYDAEAHAIMVIVYGTLFLASYGPLSKIWRVVFDRIDGSE